MKFIDANIVLRALMEPTTAVDIPRSEACRALFRRVAAGDEEITTSEAIVAELAYVMISPRQYGLSPNEVSKRLKPLLTLPGFKLPRKRLYLQALDIFATYPRLGFEDALTAAIILQEPLELLSYDSDFDRIPGVARQEP